MYKRKTLRESPPADKIPSEYLIEGTTCFKDPCNPNAHVEKPVVEEVKIIPSVNGGECPMHKGWPCFCHTKCPEEEEDLIGNIDFGQFGKDDPNTFCADCGKLIDPFDRLKQQAKAGQELPEQFDFLLTPPKKAHGSESRERGRAKKRATVKREEANAERLIFRMPKEEDEDEVAHKKAEKRMKKMIRYLMKKWMIAPTTERSLHCLEISKSAQIAHKKSKGTLMERRAEAKGADEKAVFSSNRKPYNQLGDVMIDTVDLMFDNLPPQLKLDTEDWYNDIKNKRELEEMRNAPLKRLANLKLKRPNCNRGKIKRNVAGSDEMSRFIQDALNFQRRLNGTITYTGILEEWALKKERDSQEKDSPFGSLRQTVHHSKEEKKEEEVEDFEIKSLEGSVEDEDFDFDVKPKKDQGFDDKTPFIFQNLRRTSIVKDDEKFHQELLHFEGMMVALFHTIRSLLNIEKKDLKSRLQMPPSFIRMLRDHSPEIKLKKKPRVLVEKKKPKKESLTKKKICKKALQQKKAEKEKKKSAGEIKGEEETEAEKEFEYPEDYGEDEYELEYIKKTAEDLDIESTMEEEQEEIFEAEEEGEEMLGEMDQMFHEVVEHFHRHHSIAKETIHHRVSLLKKNTNMGVEDIIGVNPYESNSMVVEEIKRLHEMKEMNSLKNEEPIEVKLKKIYEDPRAETIRNFRNYVTYVKLFEDNRRINHNIWHKVRMGEIEHHHGMKEMLKEKRRALEEAKKKSQFYIRSTSRIPEIKEVDTPKQFEESPFAELPSEEQSRIQLLEENPHDEDLALEYIRLLHHAGVKTTSREIFRALIKAKIPFHLLEKKLRFNAMGEIDRYEWNTVKRFLAKIKALNSNPIFKIAMKEMRKSVVLADDILSQAEQQETKTKQEGDAIKRPGRWYRTLVERFELTGAIHNFACQAILMKLYKYSEVGPKTRTHMLTRLCFLTMSLPATEIGTKPWQDAITFIVVEMLGGSSELVHFWIQRRQLPFLL